MTAHNIFETISSQYFQLTNSEKKVADYVLRHRIDVQYMSISELAEECTVADATISRFCRRLGYKGYNAFKLAVANSTAGRSELNPLSGEVLPEDTIAAALAAKKVQRFLLDNAQVTTVTDAPEKE